MAKAKVRNRFTEEQQRAAVADLATMTAKEVAKKHGCSESSLWTWKQKLAATGAPKPRAARRTAAPGAPTVSIDRVTELEGENARLRRLLLDGFIQNEQNPKLKRIAEIVRDGGRNQVQEIMEALLAPDTASVPRTADPEATSENSHRKRAR
jgi:transposase-like protein